MSKFFSYVITIYKSRFLLLSTSALVFQLKTKKYKLTLTHLRAYKIIRLHSESSVKRKRIWRCQLINLGDYIAKSQGHLINKYKTQQLLLIKFQQKNFSARCIMLWHRPKKKHYESTKKVRGKLQKKIHIYKYIHLIYMFPVYFQFFFSQDENFNQLTL